MSNLCLVDYVLVNNEVESVEKCLDRLLANDCPNSPILVAMEENTYVSQESGSFARDDM